MNACIRKIFARRWELFQKTNIKVKAAHPSSSASICCVTFQCSGDRLQHLLDAAIFNFLIGNYDAHGKNFSIVYATDNTCERGLHLSTILSALSITRISVGKWP